MHLRSRYFGVSASTSRSSSTSTSRVTNASSSLSKTVKRVKVAKETDLTDLVKVEPVPPISGQTHLRSRHFGVSATTSTLSSTSKSRVANSSSSLPKTITREKIVKETDLKKLVKIEPLPPISGLLDEIAAEDVHDQQSMEGPYVENINGEKVWKLDCPVPGCIKVYSADSLQCVKRY